MPLIRSISGLRATQVDALTPNLIADYTAAIAKYFPFGKIIIGRDGRPSGKWIEQVIVGTLAACGRSTISLGIVPTPIVQLYVEHTNAVGGIAITASHNPEKWNGMKFINSNGVFLDKKENEAFWNIIDNKDFEFSNDICLPETEFNEDDKLYMQLLKAVPLFSKDIIENIRLKKYKVVVDAVNASGSFIIPELLEYFGCDVVKLYCNGTGIFPHKPEPLPENLNDLAEAVKIHNADFGIAVDPDADRLVLVDDTGKLIGEERTITLTTYMVLKNFEKFGNQYNKSAVVNYSTTRAVEDIVNKYNGTFYRSPVGEINVVSKMKEVGAVIGGEGSGGIILPAFHYGRDSIIGTAIILALLAESNTKLSIINQELPQYNMIKTKFEYTGNIENLIEKVADNFKGEKITKEDGIRIDTNIGWVQLRASNTEPIIRIIAEASSYAHAMDFINVVKKMI